ncbi:MAG TPA: hypothetical protein VFX70_05285 [Mycobacteriales bacterium]|nr:hypothetical protein [Mycobacteriales bacterium]
MSRPTTRPRGHGHPGWWQQRAAANAALAMREFVTSTARAARDAPAGGTDELLVTVSAGLAVVVDLHHPDERGACAACSHLPAPWRWMFRVRWPCPLLRTLTHELDHATEER